MDDNSSGWLKSILLEQGGNYHIPEHIEHADEQVYHLADPWTAAGTFVGNTKGTSESNYQAQFTINLSIIYNELKDQHSDPQECCTKIHGFIKSIYPDFRII